ncbi:alpha-ketoglutarate-dependent dioxygenase AlkB [Ottowia thiooxydans]|uniref:alpha-ketoglutarate-dependent dioxygenase AlkB n=1 Tax=Ottowia thiooxydans TaxID=219182 RepID=UPI0006887CCC|nr:alpha-ketoglutarate-dependent dioxygenase AlkB [Ottowia thiooxydans]
MNIQLSLLADETVELVRDAEGGIRYYPGCVPERLVSEWFSALGPLIPWRSDRRPMYDRIVDVPRLMASASLNDPDCPPCIKAALEAVQTVAPAPYTRVGLNLYRDEHDSVAMHNDRTNDLMAGYPIAIFSLGAPRDMLIRSKKGGPSQRITLDPGSVLVMSHASQHTHDHGIPKCSKAQGPRISLAFRVRTAA